MDITLTGLNINPHEYRLTGEFRQPVKDELYYNFKTNCVTKCMLDSRVAPYPIVARRCEYIFFKPLFDYRKQGFEYTGELRQVIKGEFFLPHFDAIQIEEWTDLGLSHMKYPVFVRKVT